MITPAAMIEPRLCRHLSLYHRAPQSRMAETNTVALHPIVLGVGSPGLPCLPVVLAGGQGGRAGCLVSSSSCVASAPPAGPECLAQQLGLQEREVEAVASLSLDAIAQVLADLSGS